MAKYILAYHGGGGMPDDPAEVERIMGEWSAWFATLGDAIVDGGNPTGAAKTVNSDGSVSNGGGANPLGGYTLISAANLDAAVVHAQGCPILGSGGSVEVAETIDI
jgi:hypothetical protein